MSEYQPCEQYDSGWWLSGRWNSVSEKIRYLIPDSKVHGDNMGPIWGQQVPGGPHVGPMNFTIWDFYIGNVKFDMPF